LSSTFLFSEFFYFEVRLFEKTTSHNLILDTKKTFWYCSTSKIKE